MKKLNKSLKVIIMIITLISSISLVNAQQLLRVGVQSHFFHRFAINQYNSNWCWAASLQMIFNYYGINITQQQIVARTYGVSPTGELPDWAGSVQAITANLNNWSIDASGRRYIVNALYQPGAPNPTFLINELSYGRPVLVGYHTGGNTGHAVVITACSYYNTPNGPYIQSIVVRDPYATPQTIQTSGRIEYNAAVLANNINSHWFITIK